MNSCHVREIELNDGRSLKFGGRSLVMGILNATPDSFFDGGSYGDVGSAVEAALRMEQDGAEIIDVGGESTRPGSEPVSADEEILRVVPVIGEIRKRSNITISIDTCKAEVAAAAMDTGADIINDITALSDPRMVEIALEYSSPVILMHMKGTPKDMQAAPDYDDVLSEVCDYLRSRAEFAKRHGIPEERVIVDPGFGFGKTFKHNATMLENLDKFVHTGYPVLVGVSRKSMIDHALGLPKQQRLLPSVAMAVMAVERGAAIIRVHDVRETVMAIRMAEAILSV